MQNLNDILYVNPDNPEGLSWKVERRMGKGVGYIYATPGDIAGSFNGKYYTVTIDGIKYKNHRIVYHLSHGNLSDEEIEFIKNELNQLKK